MCFVEFSMTLAVTKNYKLNSKLLKPCLPWSLLHYLKQFNHSRNHIQVNFKNLPILTLIGKSWKTHPEIFLKFSFSGSSHKPFDWKTHP